MLLRKYDNQCACMFMRAIYIMNILHFNSILNTVNIRFYKGIVFFFFREYLKDIVETAHIFLKMLEHFSSKNRNMFVQRKAKSRAKKKNSKLI